MVGVGFTVGVDVGAFVGVGGTFVGVGVGFGVGVGIGLILVKSIVILYRVSHCCVPKSLASKTTLSLCTCTYHSTEQEPYP